MGAGWPYQTLQLQGAKAPIKEIVPLPTTGWADTWMLAKKAPHPNCAYMWMKYVTTPQVEAKQALVFGETPVNPKACPFMNKLEAGSCAKYHLNEPASYYGKIKFWKTPVAAVRLAVRERLHGLQRLAASLDADHRLAGDASSAAGCTGGGPAAPAGPPPRRRGAVAAARG